MPQEAEAPTRDSGLACLTIIARFHGLPVDVDGLRHRFQRPGECFSTRDILLAGRTLDLKLRPVRPSGTRLSKAPLPAIARLDGRFVVLAALDGDQALIHDPHDPGPRTLSRQAFDERWTGQLILVARSAGRSARHIAFGFRWFWPAVVRYRGLFAEVLAASFFLQLFALITPIFFQVIIDKVLVHQGVTTLHVLAIGLLAVSVFDVVLGGLRTYVFSHTTNRIDVLLGARLFAHLVRLPLAYFEARRVGDSVARVRELENIRQFLTGSSLTLVIDLLFTVVFFAVLFLYSPLLTAIVAGSVPLYVLLSVWVTPVLRGRLEELFNRGAENQAFLVETVTGIGTLKAMAVEPQMQRRWEDQLAAYVSAGFRARNLGNVASQLAGLINKVSVVLILWIGATLVMRGELSVGQLVAFNMIAARISGPILRLVQLWQDFQQAGVSVRRLSDILNTPPEGGHGGGRTSLPRVTGAVRFEHVRFRYGPDRPLALDDVSLAIAPGEVVGLVGRSGSGKSTLTRLLQRLHVPESGRILVDGVDLALVDPSWLRRQIGVVPQESFLFARSVRDNIALADPSLPTESVVAAARLAGAHDFILELPEGYDTVVGEQGVNLSGGQRQRIAIARALIGDPRILIFDEATSALDYESEQVVQRNMRAICRGRSVVIIAHRLSAVRHADRIVVVDHGRVVEQGDHESLARGDGIYARLHALQGGLPSVERGRAHRSGAPAGGGGGA